MHVKVNFECHNCRCAKQHTSGAMAHQIEDTEIEDEQQYDEAADEDFNPEDGVGDDDASSSEDEEEQKVDAPKRAGRKRKSEAINGELDSGDEATINERKSKKRRRKGETKGKPGATATGDDEDEEDSGGEGGLIRTRAQRLAEKVERKHRRRAREGEVTIDVESMWAELAALPLGRQDGYVGVEKKLDWDDAMDVDEEGNKENLNSTNKVGTDEDELITIKRRIEYAGEVTEVEERVPRSSKEAQRYLAEHPEADPKQKSQTPDAELQRPLRRPSMFEPNPTGLVKGVAPERLRPRAPSRLDVLMAEKRAAEERQKKAEKMTTVQKSAIDWRGFVEGQKGLREELDEYGKSKRGYLAREDFLGRVEFARDVQAKAARLKG